MEAAGFVYRRVAGIACFSMAPMPRARDAVHVLFTGEKVYPPISSSLLT